MSMLTSFMGMGNLAGGDSGQPNVPIFGQDKTQTPPQAKTAEINPTVLGAMPKDQSSQTLSGSKTMLGQ